MHNLQVCIFIWIIYNFTLETICNFNFANFVEHIFPKKTFAIFELIPDLGQNSKKLFDISIFTRQWAQKPLNILNKIS